MADYQIFETTHANVWMDRFGEEHDETMVHRVEDHFPDLLRAVASGEIGEDEASELWNHWGGRLHAAACSVFELRQESSMECPPRADGDGIVEDVLRMEQFIVDHAATAAAYGYP